MHEEAVALVESKICTQDQLRRRLIEEARANEMTEREKLLALEAVEAARRKTIEAQLAQREKATAAAKEDADRMQHLATDCTELKHEHVLLRRESQVLVHVLGSVSGGFGAWCSRFSFPRLAIAVALLYACSLLLFPVDHPVLPHFSSPMHAKWSHACRAVPSLVVGTHGTCR